MKMSDAFVLLFFSRVCCGRGCQQNLDRGAGQGVLLMHRLSTSHFGWFGHDFVEVDQRVWELWFCLLFVFFF